MSNWDGRERRNVERRGYNADPVGSESELIHELYTIIQQQQHQTPPSSYYQPTPPSVDITKNTITIKDLVSLGIVLASSISGGFIIWNNLNNRIQQVDHQFELFKSNIERSVLEDEKAKVELKTELAYVKGKVDDLDATVTQIYQKITKDKP
jgi:hypothetical protein